MLLYLPEAFASGVLRMQQIPTSGLYACFLISFIWILASLLSRRKRARIVPGVYISGLNGGKRTLKQARQAFTHSCADMMLEGYQQVRKKQLNIY